MANFETLRKNLEENGFEVSCFATAAEACDYLDNKLDGKTVGHGGSVTLQEMGLLDRLGSHAVLYRHQPGNVPAGRPPPRRTFARSTAWRRPGRSSISTVPATGCPPPPSAIEEL